MHPRVWEASGHVEGFTDPLVECKTCKKRFREDQLDAQECPGSPRSTPASSPTANWGSPASSI